MKDINVLHNSLNPSHAAIHDIDANVHRLVRNIELLAYINPLNIAQERKLFFKEKFNYEPVFNYRKVKFKPYKLHRLFFSQRLERIEDESIQSLYKDVIYTYSGLVQCIETIKEPSNKFYFNSLRFFGTPTEKMVENAKFILHHQVPDSEKELFKKSLTTQDAIDYFTNFKSQYGFDFSIKLSTAMSAAAMVSNNEQTLYLKKNHKFSQHELELLAHHEVGVHLVTTFNAIEQPLKVFSNGFPNNVETQEGLAVMSEYLSGNLTITRLRELAYRVIAVDSLNKGYSFADTFDLIHGQYKLNKEKAFNITLRVHRGGGFTKDALYLSGLKKVYDLYSNGTSFDPIMMGKCSIEYTPIVQELLAQGLATSSKYTSHSLKLESEVNPTVDFILKNLK
ncbi:MAG: flavohemoglobin expression-modulating QEGLA motif protein [Nonlabens sp.]|uniref:flavohemoglobin expression-modulating QEGLA motif protein n=1 Tax=Nonlabens sp. TaxID=1888209 RepID=UPI003EF54C05